jgi:hypothetical protein
MDREEWANSGRYDATARTDIIGMKKLLLYLVAYVIMLPTILVAAPLTFVGLVVACDSIFHLSAISPLAIFSIILFGDLGIASMCILFLHYQHDAAKPPLSRWHDCALLGGTAVSLALMRSFGGSLLFRALFFGWPLVGAVFFLGLLSASRKATRQTLWLG